MRRRPVLGCAALVVVLPALLPAVPAQRTYEEYIGTCDGHLEGLGVNSNGGEGVMVCPSGCVSGRDVYGCHSNNRYTWDSPVCRAAVHAGFISNAGGGYVRFKTFGSRNDHRSCSKNGVSTKSWGHYDSFSLFLACPPGHYPSGGNCVPCGAATKFQPYAGEASCKNVQVGYFSQPLTQPETMRTAERVCHVGRYCVGGLRYDCAAGRYGATTGLATADCTGECAAGYFCPEMSSSAQANKCGAVSLYCPAGSGAPLGVSAGEYSTPLSAAQDLRTGVATCPAGYWCASGVRSVCPGGTYGSATGLSSPACSGTCPAGYFCPEQSTAGTTNPCGGADTYCPAGSPSAQSVSGGEYTVPEDGDATLRTGVATCPAGSWCSGGVRQLCAVGRYAGDAGRSSECTNACAAGRYCAAGSAEPLDCGSAAVYCPLGTSAPQAVPGTHYSTPTAAAADRRSGVAQCEPGYYCAFGTRTECPGGTFGATAGLTSSACTDRCTAGYYCPLGSVAGDAHACGTAAVYCPVGSSAPLPVTPGHFTTPATTETVAHRTGEAECPVGSYCADGVRTSCPAGRYGVSAGMASLAAGCELCTAGYSCPLDGSRLRDREPCGGVATYCPEGTVTPLLVDTGYYSTPTGVDATARTAQAPCPPGSWCLDGVRTLCPAGYYGAVGSGSSPNCTAPCGAGFYCPPGSMLATQQPCPAGSYCPGGGVARVACPVGTFNANPNGVSAANCTACPAGTFQDATGVTSEALCRPCPGAEWSVAGSASCWPALVAVTAFSASVPTAGIRDGDYLELVFSKDTNQPALTTATLPSRLVASTRLAATLIPSWESSRRLRVELSGVDTTLPPAEGGVDVAASAIGTLLVGIQPGWLRDAGGVSAPTDQPAVLVNGTWGVATMPQLLFVEAVNTGGSEGLSTRDTLRLRFDQAVQAPPVDTTAALNAVLRLEPPLFTRATGTWDVDAGANSAVLDVTLLELHPAATPNATWFGHLSVTLLGGVLSLDGASPPANGTAALTHGSWGEPPCRVQVRVHSNSSLLVTVTPPLRSAATARFQVQWSYDAAFPPAPATTTVQSSSPDVLLAGLQPGVPVFVRAATGDGGTDAVLGPYLHYLAQGRVTAGVLCGACSRCSCAAAPWDVRDVWWHAAGVPDACRSVVVSPPVVDAVELPGERLATTGGQPVLVRGRYLGVPGWTHPAGDPAYVRVWYGRSRYVFEAVGCAIRGDALHEATADDAGVATQTIECTSAPGVGGDLNVVVHVGGGHSAPSAAGVSYEAPVISGFSGNGTLGGTTGGDVVFVHGKQFGRQVDGAVDAVTYTPSGFRDTAYHAAGCQLVEDHTLIRCETVPGAGSRLDWVVTVAGQASTTPFTAYRAPVVSLLQAATHDLNGTALPPDAVAQLHGMDTAGGQYVDVVGSDFGAGMGVVSGVAYVNGEGVVVDVPVAACRMVEPHVRLRCVTQPGVGVGFHWAMTVLDQAATSDNAAPSAGLTLSYAPPVVTAIQPAPSVTSAGGTLVFVGTGFGPAATVSSVVATVNGDPLPGVSFVAAHTELALSLPYVPYATLLVVTLAVAGQPLAAPLTVAVADPEVTQLKADLTAEPPAGVPDGLSADGAQPFQLLVGGTSLGAELSDVSANVTSSADGTVHPCFVTRFTVPHSALECWTTFRGVGALSLSVRNTVIDPLASFVFSTLTEPPNVALVTVVDGHDGALPSTGGVLSVTGANLVTLGLMPQVWLLMPDPGTPTTAAPDVVLAAAVWALPCAVHDDDTLTESRVQCTVGAGAGTGLRVAVRDRGITGMSPTDAASYAPPTVRGVTPGSGPTAGGGVVTLAGRNFGPPSAAATVTVGNAAVPVVGHNHTHLWFVAPPGVSTADGLRVAVTVGGLASTPDALGRDMFVFDPPSLAPTYSITTTSPTQGGGVLAVTGANFGPAGALAVSLVDAATTPPGEYGCAVEWNNHTHAVCEVGEGYGADLQLRLSNGGRAATFPFAVFGYLPPTLAAVYDYDAANGTLLSNDDTKGRRPAAGGFVVAAVGSSFSPVGTVFVGDVACAALAASVPHTRTVCTAPPRVAMSSLVRVVSQDGRSSFSLPFEYDPPVVDSVANREGAAQVVASQETRLTVQGLNFGAATVPFPRAVLLNGEPCPTYSFSSDSLATCNTPEAVPVGQANVTVMLGGDGTAVHASHAKLLPARCGAGFYGLVGELCAPCPEAATCRGELHHPEAAEGFFRVSRDVFLQCEPREACPAGSGYPVADTGEADARVEPACTQGYTGLACSLCRKGYYRLEVQCKKCPDSAWVFIVIFVVVVALLLLLAYWVNKKQINLAGVTIAFDFAWPIELQSAMNTVSAANFNLQILAPECTATFTFRDKWLVIQSIPLVMLLLLGVAFAFLRGAMWLHTRHGDRSRRLSAVAAMERRVTSALLGVFLTMMYYLYLQLARNTLTVFDCSTKEDGTRVLDSEPAMLCSSDDDTYRYLFPLAVVSVLVYVIGIPVGFAGILFRYRLRIMADQELRVKGRGGDASNPNLDVRRRFQKLYNDFRPECFYWRLVLMSRKCSLAFSAIMFDSNVMFQASLCVFILFISYAIHQRFQPFMRSPPVPPAVKQALLLKSQAKRVGDARARDNAYRVVAAYTAASRDRSLTYVFDYNRLETALLLSCTTMLVGGMVFASATRESFGNVLVQRGSVPYFILTAILVIILFASVFSFLGIIAWEMYRSLKLAKLIHLGAGHRKKLGELATPTNLESSGLGSHNPLFLQRHAEASGVDSKLTPSAATRTRAAPSPQHLSPTGTVSVPSPNRASRIAAMNVTRLSTKDSAADVPGAVIADDGERLPEHTP